MVSWINQIGLNNHELIHFECSRKAKYCSKQCQSKAWSEGHRWWCVERTHTSSQFNLQSDTGVNTPVGEPSENRTTATEPVIAINGQAIGMERATTPTVTAEPQPTAATQNEPPPTTIVQRTFGSLPTSTATTQQQAFIGDTSSVQGQNVESSDSNNLMDIGV